MEAIPGLDHVVVEGCDGVEGEGGELIVGLWDLFFGVEAPCAAARLCEPERLPPSSTLPSTPTGTSPDPSRSILGHHITYLALFHGS